MLTGESIIQIPAHQASLCVDIDHGAMSIMLDLYNRVKMKECCRRIVKPSQGCSVNFVISYRVIEAAKMTLIAFNMEQHTVERRCRLSQSALPLPIHMA